VRTARPDEGGLASNLVALARERSHGFPRRGVILTSRFFGDVAVDAIAATALLSLLPKEIPSMATAKKTKPLSKSAVLDGLIKAVGDQISRKRVKQVVEALVAVGHKELKKKAGVFVLHGFAKFSVVKKPARPAREGINPFTKEKQKFAAKPASKGVGARAVKAIKDAVV
jgi:DNA-binding protein HU-beta